GFATYDDKLPMGAEGWLERPAAQTTTAAIEWAKRAKSPWFLWVHYYDPHDPYTPPSRFVRPGPHGDYLGEVAFAVSEIGRLRSALTLIGGGPTLTVFAGDHGESFGEHEEHGHGYFIYDSTVLVPLVVSLPGRVAPAARKEAARLVDVTPTVLDLL